MQFRLRRPFPLLPDALAKPTSYIPVIMPERLSTTPATQAVAEIVGSGPYRYVAAERVPGSLNVYRRFEGYRPRQDGSPSFTAGPRIAHFDRVEWRTIPDGATAAGALRSGEIDWWEQPLVDLVPDLMAQRAVRVELVETAGLIGQIRLNHTLPPFDNPAISRALLSAVDQGEMMDAVAGSDPAIRRGPAGVFTPGGPMASAGRPGGADRPARSRGGQARPGGGGL